MKEATGELNTTVIVVIAIGAFSAFFFTIIWPMLNNDLERSSNCGDAICEPCADGTSTCEEVVCRLHGEDKNTSDTFTCPNKG